MRVHIGDRVNVHPAYGESEAWAVQQPAVPGVVLYVNEARGWCSVLCFVAGGSFREAFWFHQLGVQAKKKKGK